MYAVYKIKAVTNPNRYRRPLIDHNAAETFLVSSLNAHLI